MLLKIRFEQGRPLLIDLGIWRRQIEVLKLLQQRGRRVIRGLLRYPVLGQRQGLTLFLRFLQDGHLLLEDFLGAVITRIHLTQGPRQALGLPPDHAKRRFCAEDHGQDDVAFERSGVEHEIVNRSGQVDEFRDCAASALARPMVGDDACEFLNLTLGQLTGVGPHSAAPGEQRGFRRALQVEPGEILRGPVHIFQPGGRRLGRGGFARPLLIIQGCRPGLPRRHRRGLPREIQRLLHNLGEIRQVERFGQVTVHVEFCEFGVIRPIAERDGNDRKFRIRGAQAADEIRTGKLGQPEINDGEFDLRGLQDLDRLDGSGRESDLIPSRLFERLTDQDTELFVRIDDKDRNRHATNLSRGLRNAQRLKGNPCQPEGCKEGAVPSVALRMRIASG